MSVAPTVLGGGREFMQPCRTDTLHLEAGAAGIQGTGIGCYFDDVLHQPLGLKTTRLQDIYHFTLGSALVDKRMISEPVYAHLPRRSARGLL